MQVFALGLSKRIDVPLSSNVEADNIGSHGVLSRPCEGLSLLSTTQTVSDMSPVSHATASK